MPTKSEYTPLPNTGSQASASWATGLFDLSDDWGAFCEGCCFPCCTYAYEDQHLSHPSAEASMEIQRCLLFCCLPAVPLLSLDLRARARTRWNIEEEDFGCCKGFFCVPCSLAQIQREALAHHEHCGGICTKPPAVSEAVVPPTSPPQQRHHSAKKAKSSSVTAETNRSKLSACVSTLPPKAERFKCHHVYDGDTLTLDNGERVRFLGIDTPEVKEKQPFAQEAKKIAVDLCSKKEIWLDFDHERADHYGRLLAYVYAANPRTPSGYVFVNAEQIANGTARYYNPGSDLKHKELLLTLQHDARAKRVGIWSLIDENATVYTTRNGKAYHRKDCPHLAEIRHLNKLTVKEALDHALAPCRECMDDQ